MGAGHLWFHTPTQYHAGEQYPHNILYGARQAMIIVRSIKKKAMWACPHQLASKYKMSGIFVLSVD